MHSFSSLYNENTVISKEYTGPLDFDLPGVDCIYIYGVVVVSYILSYLGYRSLETLQRVLLLETFAAVGTAAIDERTDETRYQSPVPAESGDATEMVHGAESCSRDRPRIG